VAFQYHHVRVTTLDRYLLRELLVPFFLGLAVFTSILLIARILKLIEMVVSRGVPIGEMLRLFSYILPAFLEVTVPMALLLAILVAFGRLSSDGEIVALQASGVSLYRLMVPVGVFAACIAVVTLFLSLRARPWGNSLLRTGIYEIVKARASAGIKPKVFNDEFEGLVVYVDRVDPMANRLHGVLISDTRSAGVQNTIYGRMGIVVTNEEARTLTLRLLDGGIYTTTPGTRAYQDTRFRTYDINLDFGLALAALRSRQKDPTEMTWHELWEAIEGKEARQEPAFAERVEIQRKFAIPFACLIFAAIGTPLGIRPSRAVHSRGFSVSLILIFIYYLLLTLGQNLGERGAVPPVVASWLPNALLSVVAAVVLAQTARGERGTHPGSVERAWWSLRTRFASRPTS
jgi:lipopolysaccharide export system permease protein